MNKLAIGAASLMLLALLAGCAGNNPPRGSDGSYLSTPAHQGVPGGSGGASAS